MVRGRVGSPGHPRTFTVNPGHIHVDVKSPTVPRVCVYILKNCA